MAKSCKLALNHKTTFNAAPYLAPQLISYMIATNAMLTSKVLALYLSLFQFQKSLQMSENI